MACSCFFRIVLLALVVSGCSAGRSAVRPEGVRPGTDFEAYLPAIHGETVADRFVRTGVRHLQEGRHEESLAAFNRALRSDPRNSSLNMLCALTYQRIAASVDAGRWEYAESGYRLAQEFDPNNVLAARQLARMYLRKKQYEAAQECFARVLLYEPDSADDLYGLAAASYYIRDLGSAAAAIGRAEALRPTDPYVLRAAALIAAATGDRDRAQARMARYASVTPNSVYAAGLAGRLADWCRLHDRVGERESAGQLDTDRFPLLAAADSDAGEAGETDEVPEAAKMVLVQATIIRSEAIAASNVGINLLEGLQAQFNASYAYEDESDGAVLSYTLSVPEINYNLSIFNTGQEKSEILARPVIVALDGEESSFHAGETQHVAVSGVYASDIESISVGVDLSVIPTFLSENTVQLAVTAERSAFEEARHGTFNQAARETDTKITSNVILRMGQTLVLSGLSEKETEKIRTGVPLLRHIPIVKYLFSTVRTLELNKSIIILLTPRKASHAYYDGRMAGLQEKLEQRTRNAKPSLKELRLKHRDWFVSGPLIETLFERLRDNRYYREFRTGDIYVERWLKDRSNLDDMIVRTLKALYSG